MGYVNKICDNVYAKLMEADAYKQTYGRSKKFKIREVCNDLSIFDWWNEDLSVSQLKQMKDFMEKAIDRGFTGYVCFKVGAKYCAHGMWAYKKESLNGYSPDGPCLYHSFRNGDNYWDLDIGDMWLHDIYPDRNCEFKLSEIDKAIKEYKV